MYASVTRTSGTNEDMAVIAVMAGETMVEWLRQIDGFEGLLILTDEASGTARVISLWASHEVAERHREARMRLRDRITATVNAHVEETVYFDVPYWWFGRER